MRNAALMTVAIVLLCSTSAFAGGRRDNGTLRIVNSTVNNVQLFVLVNPSQATLTFFQNPANQTAAKFRAKGGLVVLAGGLVDVRAVPGTQAQVFASATANPADFAQAAVNIQNAGTVSLVRFNGAPGAGVPPTFQFTLDSLFGRDVMFASLSLGGIGVLVLAGLMLNRKKA